KRLGAPAQKEALGYVFKTVHQLHGGKLSLVRLLSGRLDDGATLLSSSGESGRVSGILGVNGAQDTKRSSAEAGDTVALGKLGAGRQDRAASADQGRAHAGRAVDVDRSHRPQG